MTGDDLKRLRERRGIEQDDLATLLNQSLGKSYTAETIARWERGRPISKSVSAFLDELAVSVELDALAPAADGEPIEPGEWEPLGAPGGRGDSVPPGPGPVTPQPALVSSGSPVWTRACTELWELVATGIGMLGAATGNDALIVDGQIVNADKEALGAAWGKLAETNETFRKMLVGMTEGGAWLQVALVTGTTASKCWQAHGQIAAAAAAHAENNGHVRADYVEHAA